MCIIKRSELSNHVPSVEMIPAQNIDEIVYGCCASLIVVYQIDRYVAGRVQDDQQ